MRSTGETGLAFLKLTSHHGRYAPLEPFEHYEHGKDADPSFKNVRLQRLQMAEYTY